MIKEAKNIDFMTTGRQPSEKDFLRISDWIKKQKKKKLTNRPGKRHQIKNILPNIGCRQCREPFT